MRIVIDVITAKRIRVSSIVLRGECENAMKFSCSTLFFDRFRIGRTGIFILLHLMIQCITFNKKVNIASVLRVMREHRMSLIDRTYAYVFVYRCLIDYLKSSRLI